MQKNIVESELEIPELDLHGELVHPEATGGSFLIHFAK